LVPSGDGANIFVTFMYSIDYFRIHVDFVIL